MSTLVWSSKEQLERNYKLIGGYAAFVAALVAIALLSPPAWHWAWIPMSLLALSLPSLIAFLLLDFGARVLQRRQVSMFRGLSLALGLLPSLMGIEILICHLSWIAGISFAALTLFWLAITCAVAVSGSNIKPDI